MKTYHPPVASPIPHHLPQEQFDSKKTLHQDHTNRRKRRTRPPGLDRMEHSTTHLVVTDGRSQTVPSLQNGHPSETNRGARTETRPTIRLPEAKGAIIHSTTCIKTQLEERKQRKLDYLFRARPQQARRKRRKRRKPLHTPSPTPAVCTDPHTVANLSEIQLSPVEVTLLSKGLSFCPTPP